MSGGKISGYPTYPSSSPPIHRVSYVSTKFPTYPTSFPPSHHVSPIHRVSHLSTEFPTNPPSLPPLHRVSPPIMLSLLPIHQVQSEPPPTRLSPPPIHQVGTVSPKTQLSPPSIHQVWTELPPARPHFHPSTKFGPTLPSLPSNSRPSNQARPMILPPRPPHKMCLHVQTKIACRRGRRECYKFPYSGG